MPAIKRTENKQQFQYPSIERTDIEAIEQIGEGSDGFVFKVRHKRTGQEMARKTLKLKPSADHRKIEQELAALRDSKCANIAG